MAPVRLGVYGCGGIAQIQHLPNLATLQEEFEVTMVCDASAGLARSVARQFHVPRAVSDLREFLDSDVEAVLLCPIDPKTEAVVAAFEAGKHVFIEKPVCYSLQEMDAITAAARKAGTVGQAGYMKVYDPAFERARAEVDGMDRIRFAQVNHLHADNKLHLRQFHLQPRFDDIPRSFGQQLHEARQQAVREALGEVPEEARRAFFILANSTIHDLYGLRVMLGQPEGVACTEIWPDGSSLTTVLQYPNGARGVVSWVDLPELWDFKETLEVYGDDRRVLVSYPTGFARGILSTVTVQGTDPDGASFRKELAVDWENPFRRELRHFHECITQGTICRTGIEEARQDVALIIDIIQARVGQR